MTASNEQPDQQPDESIPDILREVLDGLDAEVTDEVIEDTMHRDALAAGVQLTDPAPSNEGCDALAGADDAADADAPPCWCGASARALRSSEAARRAALRLVDEARRKGDAIIDAARRVAADYTDTALDEAAQVIHTARNSGHSVTTERHVICASSQQAASDRSIFSAAGGTPPVDAHGAVAPVGATWHAAVVADGTYLSGTPEAVVQALDGYGACLAAAGLTTPADAHVAHRVGVELVALGVNQPASLASTITVLLPWLTGPGRVPQPAAVTLIAALAAGYTTALRDDVLAQQYAVQRAVQAAGRQLELSLRVSEAHYRRLAFFDPLTGLPNRTLWQQRLRQAAARVGQGRHLGVCLIDLVGFKHVNDQAGAATGDAVLAAVARRLQDLATPGDYLLARGGADEFVMMVEDSAGTGHMVDLAERIEATLAAPVTVGAHRVRVHARIGIIDRDATAIDPGSVLLDAEIALRRAKADDTLWAVHEPPPVEAVPSGIVPSGVAASMGELGTMALTVQPIIAVTGGHLIGLQARARWQHPHLGALDLRRIGDLTGSSATVTYVTRTALQQLCRRAVQLSPEPHAPYLGVNLPVHLIGYPEIIDVVTEALSDSGLAPARLQLQLSGIDAVPAGPHSHTVLAGLNDLGIRLALDDFGTANTSLAYLRDLPIHDLRTPATLLSSHTGDTTDSTDRALLSAMSDVAHTIGLTLTVHGVHTDLHATAVAPSGCDAVEGEHYATALPLHQAHTLMPSPPAPRAAACAPPTRRGAHAGSTPAP